MPVSHSHDAHSAYNLSRDSRGSQEAILFNRRRLRLRSRTLTTSKESISTRHRMLIGARCYVTRASLQLTWSEWSCVDTSEWWTQFSVEYKNSWKSSLSLMNTICCTNSELALENTIFAQLQFSFTVRIRIYFSFRSLFCLPLHQHDAELFSFFDWIIFLSFLCHKHTQLWQCIRFY